MGSRKKKIMTKQINILTAYRLLDINDRIAFKAWIYWFGRQRLSLFEFSKKRFNNLNFTKLLVRNCVNDGHLLINGIIK